MKRDPIALCEREHNLVVVGGGIFGVALAWEAASRGLSVALLERDDFCGAASANSFKMVHGGIRYLQHGDVFRARESCRERSALLRIAPHLVRPLPIVVPTYRSLMRGKAAMRAALSLYDLFGLLTLAFEYTTENRTRMPGLIKIVVSKWKTGDKSAQLIFDLDAAYDRISDPAGGQPGAFSASKVKSLGPAPRSLAGGERW